MNIKDKYSIKVSLKRIADALDRQNDLAEKNLQETSEQRKLLESLDKQKTTFMKKGYC